ncbi:MAG: bifunctional (p)ppGpp synthetase/guanosine-3',5'-bis(diphosphate) 3'-pyrophosphohydrolase [Actinobacteria bacterium]|nr:MAG: bifunctional (p)ppGpp synthetase/guanosine-3',5'-bis(diphosphate) 3'-pyrophosphohydrolase [Actinomycetota bacterium]
MEPRPTQTDGKRRGVLARLRPVEQEPESGVDSLLHAVKATNPKADLKLIERAYEYAAESHRDQFRASGERFIEHPLEVARILADLNMDTTTIVAALLHDVVEDTPLSIEEIEKEFGEETSHIIDGVTKLDKVTFQSKEAHQAETIRKMIIAMARDIRVLLIKLADRLHNMRTVGHLSRDTQELKARETLEIYAPLAHRLGIHQIKWQLEDLSFATLHPKQFDEIVRMVEERQPEREDVVEQVVEQLSEALKAVKIKSTVSGRPKHFWSIYQKMVIRGREFAEIYDLVGIRVTTETLRDCYGALGIIHSLWKPIPGRVKDYIAMPKFNMYQSLHTAVVGPNGKPLEIQIRTEQMHRTAEYGIAAHWKYKDGTQREDAELAWLRQMLDWQKELSDPREFMESLRIDLYQDEVFVFTPKGDVRAFPIGATPIDFAYAIHTDVGHRCVGARVNGRLVPLTTEMQSGDTIEIITSKAAGAAPSQDWLQVVKTPRARNKIRQWFTRERREDAIEKGREELRAALRKAGLPVQTTLSSSVMSSIAKDLRLPSLEAMEAAIGAGHLSTAVVIQRLEHEVEGDEDVMPVPTRPVRMRAPSEHGVVVQGVDDVLVRLARCCTPVPHDRIVGFVTRGRGVSVHRADCPNAKALLSEAERTIDVSWDAARSGSFTVGLMVQALDRQKLLRDVTTAISEMGVNILGSSSHTDPRTRTATLRFSVELADPGHLEHILSQIKRVNAVYDASRIVPGLGAGA